jgi:hypothetical protein
MPSAFLLRLRQNSQAVINITVRSGTAPDNLTGLELDFYIKTTAATLDADSSTRKLSTVTGAIVFTDAPNGKAVLTIPPSAVPLAATLYGRLDLLVASVPTAVAWGTVIVAAS